MKILFLILYLFISFSTIAQDRLVTKQNEALNVRILKEGKKEIVFIKSDDPERQLYTWSKKEIKKYYIEKPPRETNMIEIKHDSIYNEALYTDIIGFLILSGYEIESFNQQESTVNTKYKNKHRITVYIEGDRAQFQCFYSDNNEGTYPPKAARFIYGKQANDGERAGYYSHYAFKSMNWLCRSYLINNKASLTFKIN